MLQLVSATITTRMASFSVDALMGKARVVVTFDGVLLGTVRVFFSWTA